MLDFILPIFGAFILVLVMGPFVIPYLRKLKIGNTEREELKSHQVKNGTPSMGGIMILSAVFVVSLFYVKEYPNIIPVLILTLGFGAIGFLDDYLKVVKKKSDGLIAWQKFLLQIVVTTAFAVYLVKGMGNALLLWIPFSSGLRIDLGVFAIPLLYFAVIGTVNGVNFTDGLDGLSSSVTVPVALFFGLISLLFGNGVEPICGAVVGALLGFLCFNFYPAKVFMGDTGSLALGGFVAGVAYVLEMPVFILIVGFIYFVEVLSVILQVSYFKATKGKRIFRMAPIHHHFELGGWSETRVVGIFSTVTFLLCLVALLGVF